MYGLRTEQHELLRRHREEAFELLLVASAVYTGATPLRERHHNKPTGEG